MPPFLEPLAALVTATALTVGPAATGPAGPMAPAGSSVCRQNSSAQDSFGGGRQLTPERAEALLQKTRELVTELMTAAGDLRAAGLGDQLRSMGISPAVASGWRQQAHDLADTLMGSMNDPRARQVAVIFAGAGFSPTPADLKTGGLAEPAAMTAPLDSTATPVSGPALRPAVAVTEGALAAAMRRVHQATAALAPSAQPDASASGPDDAAGDSDDTAPTDSPSESPSGSLESAEFSPSGSSAVQICGTGSGGTGGQPGPGGVTPSGIGTNPGEAASPAGWERQARDLADKLAGESDDPEAKELAEKLAAAGLGPAFAGLSTNGSGSTDETSGRDNPADDTGDNAEESSGEKASGENNVTRDTPVRGNRTGSGATSSGSASSEESSTPDPGSVLDSTDPDGTDVENPGNQAGGDEDSTSSEWEGRAGQLADELAAAGDDPTARELADKLAAAGFSTRRGTPADADDNGEHSSNSNEDHEDTSGGLSASAAPDSASELDLSAADPASDPVPAAEAPEVSDGSGTRAAPAGAGSGTGATGAAVWDRLAECESGQRWDSVSDPGYAGGLQLDLATWEAYGGAEYAPSPEQATKEEQIAVATKLRDDRGGFGAWPACAARLGLVR
ncbi:transglycosylase family protein [Pseudonocardia sp. H11422]|uniref:transglycosylase family protein n=1 Tax=Pseudonocardia sp. H11422 TaxID=2835866 RepID=UPI0020281034|nr:transglycosylase family protein [Pseudonocardia sp. H11422]